MEEPKRGLSIGNRTQRGTKNTLLLQHTTLTFLEPGVILWCAYRLLTPVAQAVFTYCQFHALGFKIFDKIQKRHNSPATTSSGREGFVPAEPVIEDPVESLENSSSKSETRPFTLSFCRNVTIGTSIDRSVPIRFLNSSAMSESSPSLASSVLSSITSGFNRMMLDTSGRK